MIEGVVTRSTLAFASALMAVSLLSSAPVWAQRDSSSSHFVTRLNISILGALSGSDDSAAQAHRLCRDLSAWALDLEFNDEVCIGRRLGADEPVPAQSLWLCLPRSCAQGLHRACGWVSAHYNRTCRGPHAADWRSAHCHPQYWRSVCTSLNVAGTV